MNESNLTKKGTAKTPVPSLNDTHAGIVSPSAKRYVVTCSHGHRQLMVGDVVVVTESPDLKTVLVRESDLTLHDVRGQSAQYVHLAEAKGAVEANLEAIDLRRELEETVAALRVARSLIIRHHETGIEQHAGAFCPVCHRPDGSEPEIDQIFAALAKVSK